MQMEIEMVIFNVILKSSSRSRSKLEHSFIHTFTTANPAQTRKYLVEKEEEYLVETEMKSIWLEMRVFWKRFPPCNPRAVQLRILKAMIILPNLNFSLPLSRIILFWVESPIRILRNLNFSL